jgi:hypothetical protein
LQGDDTDVLGSNAEMEYAHCQAAVVKRATVKVNSMVGSCSTREDVGEPCTQPMPKREAPAGKLAPKEAR